VFDDAPDVIRGFPQHEVIYPDELARRLAGDRGLTIPDLGLEEARTMIARKIELGERVVVVVPCLARGSRMVLAHTAVNLGVPVFYLVSARENERNLLTGDGVAETIRTDRPFRPVCAMDLTTIRERWAGITVIGDVHGMRQALSCALAWARSRQHYVLFLGDVVDAGRDTLDVADDVYRMVMRGEASMMLGNHERKIIRWLNATDQGHAGAIRLSEGNRVTVDALSRLRPEARQRWVGRFRGLLWHTSVLREVGPITLAHAAIHPGYWDGSVGEQELESYALFGETDGKAQPRYVPSYRWIDAVPEGQTVIVGHDVRSTTAPRTVTGGRGGKVIFLDTGCGNGGVLSSADIRFGADGGFVVENLNVH
jgi:protein phosphatase